MRALSCAIVLVALYCPLALAGELDPPGAPEPSMHSLEEIFQEAAGANEAVGGGEAALIFPHVIETSGTTTNTQNSFDTSIMLVYTPTYRFPTKKGADSDSDKGLTPVSVEVYWYEDNGALVLSQTGTAVASPAVFELSPITPKVTVRLDNLMNAAGGFPSSVKLGYVVLRIQGGNWSDVAVQGFIYNAVSSAFDVRIAPISPTRVPIITSPPIPVKSGDKQE